MNVNVRIDRVVFDGVSVSPEERPILQATIESELARLIGMHRWQTPSSERVYRLAAPSIQMGTSPDGATLGKQIANSIVESSFS